MMIFPKQVFLTKSNYSCQLQIYQCLLSIKNGQACYAFQKFWVISRRKIINQFFFFLEYYEKRTFQMFLNLPIFFNKEKVIHKVLSLTLKINVSTFHSWQKDLLDNYRLCAYVYCISSIFVVCKLTFFVS